jgi:hypothetical protein
MKDDLWTYATRKGGYVRTTDLYLYWELDGDPMTDDYLVTDISAPELWDLWRQEYPKDADTQVLFGDGASRIFWYVLGDGVIEGAPFQDRRGVRYPGENFLDQFTWPRHSVTSERLRWSALSVADKLWNEERTDKGGFIQQLTGWKPSPLQPFVNIHQLEQMAGISE